MRLPEDGGCIFIFGVTIPQSVQQHCPSLDPRSSVGIGKHVGLAIDGSSSSANRTAQKSSCACWKPGPKNESASPNS